MPKLFAMFPTGTAGLALLLLRLSVAMNAVVYGIILRHSGNWDWIQFASVLAAAFVVAGCLTPIFSGCCGVLVVAAAAVTAGAQSNYSAAFAVADVIALILLGPGAYSIDARLFGRSVVGPTARDGGGE
jgi:hypothetical protein